MMRFQPCLVSPIFTVVALIFTSSLLVAQTSVDEGFTEPFKKVLVASPESGVIKSIEVREGEPVQKGDVLCRLDSKILEVALLAAKVKLQSNGRTQAAQATLANKENHLVQMKSLLEKNHASDKEVKQAQLEFDLAKAGLQTVEDEILGYKIEVQKIEAQIERRVIRAPNNGVVLNLPHQEGESVTTVESHVATIVQLDQLRVRYFLTTSQAVNMKQGAIARVTFPTTNQTAAARVEFVSPVTDSNSGTVRVELLLNNRQSLFRSGLRCVLDNVEVTKANNNRSSQTINR